jgi:hypothetical protein
MHSPIEFASALLGLALGAVWGCKSLPATKAEPTDARAKAALSASPPPPRPPPRLETPAVASAGPATPVVAGEGRACGVLGCRVFSTPRAAFEATLSGEPRVIAIGESHAQKDAPRVPSATERFRDQLLPALAGRAKGIVIEVLLPDQRCRQAEVQAVKKRQEVVTKPQAETNQNEFLALGHAAKALGLVPQPLVPTCEELRSVLAAGAADIDAMLTLVANITARETLAMLATGDPDKAVLTYGGLVHNDLEPRPGREAWSFGPRVAERTGKRYVELDLIVPEFIRPEPPWTNLAFYPHYDAAKDGAETRLFEPSPGSFVLVFPRAPREEAPP